MSTISTPPAGSPTASTGEISPARAVDSSSVSEAQRVRVSFIIPALNEEAYICRCLESIRRLRTTDYIAGIEVIVVDNQSTDRTAEVSRELGAHVLTIAPGHPSRARNAGAHAAQGDWLAFVDADCELEPDWLLMCGSHLRADSSVVAAGGTFCAPDTRSPWVERTWHKLAHHARPATAKRVRWLTIHFLVRRSAFHQVGGFDESLVTCEDCDLGYKLSELGEMILEPRTQAAHRGESRSLIEIFRREAWRTSGNLRLALRRPLDWANWVSLLLPPAMIMGGLVATAGLTVSLAGRGPSWPWIAILLAVLALMGALVIRKTFPRNVLELAQLMTVFAAYLAGRTAGLFRAFRRVERQ